MLTKLAESMVLAMWAQQWLVVITGDWVLLDNPSSPRTIDPLPRVLFEEDEREDDLRVILLWLMVVHGLDWDDEPGQQPYLN